MLWLKCMAASEAAIDREKCTLSYGAHNWWEDYRTCNTSSTVLCAMQAQDVKVLLATVRAVHRMCLHIHDSRDLAPSEASESDTENTGLEILPISSCEIFLENGRYGHAPIRSDTSIRVYTTADTDTDTSTPCVGVPATCNIRPGRSIYLFARKWQLKKNKQVQ